ncbi:uncharacterized protein K460DRAFT_116217 [Cucurbitaria berberidis CBS 394.84]|uniref:Uncharacterized protein n=1 Tax=Cucurbitaria berberidis CBS 394.84 TaxID=1168544 RepID=A0A9P4GI18_9PLEO|nr:uncharacterized protein K460DRAFT_116217 [Cucurbitaria berberidis CBS 394.84]KAF1845849.1 hypothetical protein K460DRAFT_116217 [Cucurbitaria berberidis CBS 394.84]
MTSQALEAALSELDNDASHLRLSELIAARKFDGPTLPAIAELFLRAFCDIASSSTRRRWVGIALARMIDASLDVVDHLKQLRQESQRLGTIILSNTELEETRIVAGIIIRQGLEKGIEYSNFWVSDKVMNSAPNFPKAPGPRWMAEFQSFLDTLGDLALANPNTDPSIIYPISLLASDGFKWRESNDGFPIALIQAGMLTVVAPDGLLRDIQFVDIPISHVCRMDTRRSTLHDSQAQSTGHEPWDLVLILKAEPWSYRLDASLRAGTEVTLLFQHSADAKEWEKCIMEHQKGETDTTTYMPPAAHPLMSSSSPIDLRPSPSPTTDGIMHQDGQKITTQSHSSSQSNRSRPVVSVPWSPLNEQHLEQLRTSSDQLSESLQTHRERSSRAASKRTQVRAEQQQDTTKPAQQQDRSKRPKQQDKMNTDQGHTSLPRVQESKASSSEDMPDGLNPLEQTEPVRPIPNRTTYSKGKLPKVSQAAKLKASKQLQPQADVFDIPNEKPARAKGRKKADQNNVSSSGLASQNQPQRLKVVDHTTTGNAKEKRSQAKRKADDDDDDFVPEKKRPKTRATTKRKSALIMANGAEQSREEAPVEPSEDTRVATSGANPIKAKTVAQHLAPAASDRATKVSKPRATKSKPKPIEKPSSSIASSRYSLIGGLLGSQLPPKSSTMAFKKPELPVRAPQAPSTPTPPKTRSGNPHIRPQTPMDARRQLNDEPLSSVFSSPPLGNASQRGSNWRHQTAADTEMLSSNSKPVPASPTAESTAISGHADYDEIDFEKRRGDAQTAESDPFRRRREGQKATSFTRRLTGEGLAVGNPSPNVGLSHSTPIDVARLDSSDIDDVLITAVTQPLLQHVSWRQKMLSPTNLKSPFRGNLAQVPESHKPVTYVKAKQNEMSSKQRAATQTQSTVGIGPETTHNATRRVATEVAPNEASTLHEDEAQDGEIQNPILTASRQSIDNTLVDQLVQTYEDVDMDGDATLVNYEEDERPISNLKASPVHFRSSPPIPGSPSSHSSTSAEPEPSSQSALPTSEAEEIEWEASLQPHQRAIHDLLIRTSKRVLRHIIDNETAVTDIAEIFVRDGEHVLNALLQRHDRDYDHVFHDMENKTKGLKKELERAAKNLLKERKRVDAIG